jgi:prepilin-type N-terminal cleavage/methylation domain-containing protein
MITTTAAFRTNRPGCQGFTLTELLVSMALASMVLAAVFSSLIFVTRSCLATTDYSGMDGEAREGLEKFSREVRMADGVSNFTTNGVRLHVPTASSSYWVNYTYVPTDGTFYRAYGTAGQEALITGVERFTLKRYTLLQTPANNDLETKQLQLELRAVRSGPAQAFASNNVISARYILRNKVVSN